MSTPTGPRVDHAVVSGTFSLDGETFDVDNNIWVVGDDTECVVIDAPHDVDAILAVVGDRTVKAITPPRWRRRTSGAGEAVPAQRVTMTCPAAWRRLSRRTARSPNVGPVGVGEAEGVSRRFPVACSPPLLHPVRSSRRASRATRGRGTAL